MIDENSQGREKLGPSLYLVDHDETLQRPESQRRISEKREVSGFFQIQGRDAFAEPGHELPGKRGLPDLARPEDRDDGELPEQRLQPAKVAVPGDHGQTVL